MAPPGACWYTVEIIKPVVELSPPHQTLANEGYVSESERLLEDFKQRSLKVSQCQRSLKVSQCPGYVKVSQCQCSLKVRQYQRSIKVIQGQVAVNAFMSIHFRLKPSFSHLI